MCLACSSMHPWHVCAHVHPADPCGTCSRTSGCARRSSTSRPSRPQRAPSPSAPAPSACRCRPSEPSGAAALRRGRPRPRAPTRGAALAASRAEGLAPSLHAVRASHHGHDATDRGQYRAQLYVHPHVLDLVDLVVVMWCLAFVHGSVCRVSRSLADVLARVRTLLRDWRRGARGSRGSSCT